MASVYLNDVDAYQRALDQYQRQVRGYNNQAQVFNDSFYRDAQGQQAGVVGGTFTQNMPGDRTGYGLYTDPTNTANQFLRKPTSTADVGPAVVQNLGRGNVRVYMPNGGGEFITKWNDQAALQKQIMQRGYVAPSSFNFDSLRGGRQNLALQQAQFTDAPEAPDEFKQRAPEATFAQQRRASEPTLAQSELGLISEVMRGGGLKPGAEIRRANPT